MAKKSPVIPVPVPGTFVDFGRRHIPERTTGCCKFVHFSGWMDASGQLQPAIVPSSARDYNVVQVAAVKVGNFQIEERGGKAVAGPIVVQAGRSRPEPHYRSKNAVKDDTLS
ncbi:hypothetical protein pipiens_003440 [Culex pipiens pipiens]|uniref:Uncharacterized protein n=1 Tax=Culex pipiens pipiens TaxID=38569 RepID=A0ABD1CY25_CULPP